MSVQTSLKTGAWSSPQEGDSTSVNSVFQENPILGAFLFSVCVQSLLRTQEWTWDQALDACDVTAFLLPPYHFSHSAVSHLITCSVWFSHLSDADSW